MDDPSIINGWPLDYKLIIHWLLMDNSLIICWWSIENPWMSMEYQWIIHRFIEARNAIIDIGLAEILWTAMELVKTINNLMVVWCVMYLVRLWCDVHHDEYWCWLHHEYSWISWCFLSTSHDEGMFLIVVASQVWVFFVLGGRRWCSSTMRWG